MRPQAGDYAMIANVKLAYAVEGRRKLFLPKGTILRAISFEDFWARLRQHQGRDGDLFARWIIDYAQEDKHIPFEVEWIAPLLEDNDSAVERDHLGENSEFTIHLNPNEFISLSDPQALAILNERSFPHQKLRVSDAIHEYLESKSQEIRGSDLFPVSVKSRRTLEAIQGFLSLNGGRMLIKTLLIHLRVLDVLSEQEFSTPITFSEADAKIKKLSKFELPFYVLPVNDLDAAEWQTLVARDGDLIYLLGLQSPTDSFSPAEKKLLDQVHSLCAGVEVSYENPTFNDLLTPTKFQIIPNCADQILLCLGFEPSEISAIYWRFEYVLENIGESLRW